VTVSELFQTIGSSGLGGLIAAVVIYLAIRRQLSLNLRIQIGEELGSERDTYEQTGQTGDNDTSTTSTVHFRRLSPGRGPEEQD
jgi:hypothetical protein